MQHKSIEILGYIINVLTIAIYFVMLFFLEIPSAPFALQIVGWILFIAGIALILLTILTLRKKHTESVIWSGVFSVIRHPMYLGSILLFLAMPCFLPHWIMVILAVVNAIFIYWFMLNEEQKNIKKFGDEYERYLQSVPRANLLAGFIRLLRSKQR
jgi:protein-S-isoprenylcysteine O-methyltransferase Ste14